MPPPTPHQEDSIQAALAEHILHQCRVQMPLLANIEIYQTRLGQIFSYYLG